MLEEKILERDLIPDSLIRFAIRRLLKKRLQDLQTSDQENFIRSLETFPIALSVKEANEQHYEVPATFFERVLGPRLKYSCGLFQSPEDSLEMAEEQMLRLSCDRAQLSDGQQILELGCGWGSLTLWIAEHYPRSNVLGVSNSSSQREFILQRAKQRGLRNIQILTQDLNHLELNEKFDRVISVEMFEHMRNIPLLLNRISHWLNDDGKLFVHIFSHRRYSYLFEARDRSDWMARHFFTGGMMPGHTLYRHFDRDLHIEEEWIVQGTHYSKTADYWLKNMDQHEKEIDSIFEQTYGHQAVPRWWVRWRIFFMACSELWGWNQGLEWHVSHYRFKKTVPGSP